MEYLEYLKALSSGDPLQQISSIPRIVGLIKDQPSSILVNTIAITMSVEFTQASNRVRYFILDFFSQCRTEMCMIRSKQEVFQHLMSVLDLNDPIAQCLMLKIVETLAPLLTDMVEVHHKVLLAMEGTHRQVREIAFSILPELVVYCPSIARHVFDKNIPEHYAINICKVLPDDEDTVKRAYSYIIKHFNSDICIQFLFILAYRCRSIVNHVKELLFKHQEFDKVSKLCKKYGKDNILSDQEITIINNYESKSQDSKVLSLFELLNQTRLEGKNYAEKHYKYIYTHWQTSDKYIWIIKRLENKEEEKFCYKLLYKLKVPYSYFTSIKKYSIDLALCLIRGGWRGSFYEVIFSLNSWEQYLCGCEMMKQGLHVQAHQVFLQIKDFYRGSNEKVYEWINALMEITGFENKKIGGIKAFSHMGCLDLSHQIYFQSEFFLCRYLTVHILNEIISGKVITEELFHLRNRIDKLLFLFNKPQKDTIYIVKMWRDLIGMLALCINCLSDNIDYSEKLSHFYPVSKDVLDNFTQYTSPQALCRVILEIPMNYPKQFFSFLKPIGLSLHLQNDLNLKLSKNTEFVLEFSAKVKEISHKPPNLRFNFVCTNNNKQEFKLEREKTVNAAGVCNVSLPVIFNNSGIFILKIKANILNYESREIGKPEFAEIILECI